MYGRILIPLDGSRFAEAALPLAAAVQKGTNAVLELISSHDPVPPPVGGPEEAAGMAVPVQVDTLAAVPATAGDLRDQLREERTTYLRDTAHRLREGAGVNAEVILADGRPDKAILERVRSAGANLVVMATHGRGPMERAWLGSVADRVVRESHVPVLLVRPLEEDRPDLTAGPGLRRVVVPLDGSHLAEGVLDPAVALARALDLPILLLRVIGSRMELGSTYIPHAAKEQQEQLAEERREAEAYLSGVASRIRDGGATVAGMDVVEGPTARSILDATDATGSDVIAMATHGRGGLKRMVLGSVTDKVVRAAAGPVLAVRPEGDEE
jgi:nucleotide-binding universal stress UspA family protein